MAKLLRLYTPQKLLQSESIVLSKEHSHYLCKVMRKKLDDSVLLFNNNDGEWQAVINEISQNRVIVVLEKQTRLPTIISGPSLIFAPIKNTRMPFLLEKATELGVAEIFPVLTKNSVVDKLNYDKMQLTLIEAAEQCERITIPTLHPLTPLMKLLDSWSEDRVILFCNERETNNLITGGGAILVGPEGGFTEQEVMMISHYKFVQSVKLTDTILRAETAVIAGLAQLCLFK
jgi:16S rRNA (uracil1498-N3)-methyltransferase